MASLGYTELNLWLRDDIFKIYTNTYAFILFLDIGMARGAETHPRFPVNTMSAGGWAT